MFNSTSSKRRLSGVLAFAATGALAFGLAGCSTPAEAPAESEAPAADPTPIASVPDLSNGVDTQVTVDQGFVDAITSLGLTPGVVGSATFTDGVFSFPITGGNVDYYDPEESYRPYVQGEIDHDGSGISLTAGDTTVALTDFVIDPGTSQLFGDVSVNGEIAAEDAYIFILHGKTLKPLQTEGDNAILEGTTVHVSQDAADLLNATFGTDAVKKELLVGVAKITVATK